MRPSYEAPPTHMILVLDDRHYHIHHMEAYGTLMPKLGFSDTQTLTCRRFGMVYIL
jgi:hypothetical protein